MNSPTINPNRVDDRTAMGLPVAFVDRVDHDLLRRRCHELVAAGVDEMRSRVDDPDADEATRLAAGSLLALVGDNRIDVDRPAMLDVPAAKVRLGLAPHLVDTVVEDWRHVGVARDWIAKEAPDYEIDIAAFRIARFPVTNQEYRLFLLENPDAALPTSWRFGIYPVPLGNHPVWTVGPHDADGYCRWLARRTGRRFRLPTEAEWEYAASGTDGRAYPWGDDPGDGPGQGLANTVEWGPLCTTPVGTHPAGRSPFGADDMAGNVEEYVADDYRPYPGGQPVADDLTDGGTSTYRLARGGSFTRYSDLARCRRRHGWYRREIYAMGLRLAETPGARPDLECTPADM